MDAFLYWNDVALEANRVSHSNGAGEQTGPPLSARALAIVHLAMYDAYAGIPGTPEPLPPYLPGLGAAPAGSSVDDAIAAAAYTTLTSLFPSQMAYFDAAVARSGASVAVGAGAGFGRQAALAILSERAGDPGVGSEGYRPSLGRGGHRADPHNPGQGYHAPYFGARARCFAVTTRFALKPPPAPGDPAYRDALREVRGKGITPEQSGLLPAGLSRRTPLETLIGVYWAYDGANRIGTPPRLYNQIIRRVAESKGNTLAQNAQLLTMVNVAMADAGVLAWEQKYIHDLWRPVVGIREHDGSMGPQGSGRPNFSSNCDPGWLPLGAPRSNAVGKDFTPPFPAYPSGHATFCAAALDVTRRFYNVTTPGDDDLFDGMSFVSEEHNGTTTDARGTVRPRHEREFPGGLWQMIRENSLSRVYLGVHWSFDGYVRDSGGDIDVATQIGGVPLGLNIAENIVANGLHPSTV